MKDRSSASSLRVISSRQPRPASNEAQAVWRDLGSVAEDGMSGFVRAIAIGVLVVLLGITTKTPLLVAFSTLAVGWLLLLAVVSFFATAE